MINMAVSSHEKKMKSYTASVVLEKRVVKETSELCKPHENT